MAKALAPDLPAAHMPVALCWSLGPRHVHTLDLQVPPGSTVAAVLAQAQAQWPNNPAGFPVADVSSLAPAIWGRVVSWTHRVQAGDRIALCRPLQVDPKVARRQRFKRQGPGRAGLFAKRKNEDD